VSLIKIDESKGGSIYIDASDAELDFTIE